MYIRHVGVVAWLTISLATASWPLKYALEHRQDSSGSAFPTLTGNSGSASVTGVSPTSQTSNAQTVSTSTGARVPTTSSANSGSATSASQLLSSEAPTKSDSSSASSTSSVSTSVPVTSNGATSNGTTVDNGLPLQPQITPALSVGGVILILTGTVYSLIGVKNRWAHIFLSTAYLTSLSICVLIVYVMNPPVSNAIQGAYLVGIFMTGVIFGAGALIFKEVTEGLGCLLGGFTLAMWFLTLKSGGLITSNTGKGIFIAIFCALAWSLSFSHYTRPYALMGSVAFSGATAFVLGIDCFSRGGLKEFWLYIWGLNPNLFPLQTNTYPITRGTRVETIVIVLACIIGIISQIKLWKVVKDRQAKRDEARQEEEQRREVVEAALGRHLERQNDRDKTQWERQYGDRLNAKRETVLWADTLKGEKRYSRISEMEMGDSHKSSSDSLEMSAVPRKPKSVYVGRVKRQSSMMAPQTILEGEEGETKNQGVESTDKETEQQKSLAQLEGKPVNEKTTTPPGSPMPSPMLAPSGSRALKVPSSKKGSRDSRSTSSNRESSPANRSERQPSSHGKHLATPDEDNKKKRLSWSSMFSRSPRDSISNPQVSISQEALVVPQTSLHHSRASSLAATLDYENETMDLPTFETGLVNHQLAPEIVVSPAYNSEPVAAFQRERHAALKVSDEPPSPPALVENFDLDPEELVRSPAKEISVTNTVKQSPSHMNDKNLRGESGSEIGADASYDDGLKQSTITSDTSASEVLTKNALDQVPNHLSNVVLSYRTNEWAKHIATAEAPLYEEPQAIEVEDNEEPAHLANDKDLQSPKIMAEPPPLLNVHTAGSRSPVETAISSPTEGVHVNPATQTPSQYPTAMRPESIMRVRSASETNKMMEPRGFRSSSTPLLKQTLQETSIDENSATFNPRQHLVRSVSNQSLNQSIGRNSLAPNWPTNAQRSTSRLSHVTEHPEVLPRSNSQMSNYAGMVPRSNSQQSSHHVGNMAMPMRSETRMASYNSHQPVRRDTSVESQLRDARYMDWRASQANSTQNQIESAEAQRQQLLWQRQQEKAIEEEERIRKANMEMVLDARMRSRDMQELHREALRRMQRGANEKLN